MSRLPKILSFDGRLARLPYALLSLFLLAVVYAPAVAIGFEDDDYSFSMIFSIISPLRAWLYAAWQMESLPAAAILQLAFLAVLVMLFWLLVALAFRRTADARLDPWIAAFVMAPVIQVPVILCLCVVPTRLGDPDEAPPLPRRAEQIFVWRSIAAGVVAGGALTLAAVALGALVFGSYGYGMFVLSPFIIGAVTAYIGNRSQDLGAQRTLQIVLAALGVGGVALVATALEGIVCIVIAAPLAILLAWLGGLLGRTIANAAQGRRSNTVYALALIPLMFSTENLLPAETDFATVQRIEVAAPPDRVWQALIRMDRIDGELALPFRLGVAYPIRGVIDGAGVGAIRRGEFSTGTALERVTAWEPGRKLAFVVATDVPAMRELSPYEHVHAPHIEGYFRTGETSFVLNEMPDGHTEIVERTAHTLRLDPILYWLPLARWVVAENNARVLASLKHRAERAPRD